MRIEIIADLVCPWCYIGKHRLERALAMRPWIKASFAWRPFQLNPDLPAGGVPREIYLLAKFGSPTRAARTDSAIAAIGRTEGIAFGFERIRLMPNTLKAHRLIRLSAGINRADSVIEALFAAHFREGRDIGAYETLLDVAAAHGLDPVETRLYLAGEEGEAEIRAEDRRARELGVHAVPYFIIDEKFAISGAQDCELFLPILDLAAELDKRSPVAAVR